VASVPPQVHVHATRAISGLTVHRLVLVASPLPVTTTDNAFRQESVSVTLGMWGTTALMWGHVPRDLAKPWILTPYAPVNVIGMALVVNHHVTVEVMAVVRSTEPVNVTPGFTMKTALRRVLDSPTRQG